MAKRNFHIDKNLFFTESCNAKYDLSKIKIKNKKLSELYSEIRLNKYYNRLIAWTGWNILSKGTGGSNSARILCCSLDHYNNQRGNLNFINSYSYSGYFSKLVLPEEKRILGDSTTNNLLTINLNNTYINQN